MNKISKIAAAAALTVASVSANAWYGAGPYSGIGDFFGDGNFDMSFHMGGGARSSMYGYGYRAPYWAAPYYGYAPAATPAAATAGEAQKAWAEQQAEAAKAYQEAAQQMAAQQADAFKKAVEAQRQYAEQYAGQMPVVADPAFTMHQDMMKRMGEDFASMQQDVVSMQQEFAKRVQEDQVQMWEDMRNPFGPMDFARVDDRFKEASARRAEAMKEMEARRAEVKKMIEAQRTSVRRDFRRDI